MNSAHETQAFVEQMRTFLANRHAVPPEALEQYAGRWVAWAPDGKSIVASSALSENDLVAQVIAAGYELSRCCLSYMPGPDEAFFGGLPPTDAAIGNVES